MNLPAEKGGAKEAPQKYKLQPKHQPRDHTVLHQIIAQVLYTIEQKPNHIK